MLSVIMPVGGDLSSDLWRARSFDWVRDRYESLLPDAQIAFGTSIRPEYNRSEARNNAFESATGDVLLVADADTIFQPDVILEAVDLVEKGAPWVIPYGENRYYNLSKSKTAEILGKDPASHIEEPEIEDEWEHKITSTAGLLVLPRSAWETAGGYDEEFRQWGYEDDAFRTVLNRKVGAFVRIDSYVMHLWHPASEETRFGQPYIQLNRDRALMYKHGILP